jgi:hypothetical protein
MPAEFSHDSLNPAIQTLLPPHAERARVLAFLAERQDAIAWVGLATGLDVGRRLLDGNMGVDVQWQSASVHGTGDEVFAASTPGFVGETVMAVMGHFEKCRNRYLCVSEVGASYGRILAVLEAQMGCGFEVGCVEREEGLREAKRRIEGGWPDAGMFLLERCVLADERCFAGFDAELEIRTMLGVEGGSLEGVVKSVLHDFRHHGKGGCGCS